MTDEETIASSDVADAASVLVPPGPDGKRIQIAHPETGEQSEIVLPADHDGSRVKVEFPDGATTFTEGFDPAERALSGERPTVPCGNCGSPQVLTQESFICSACGVRNEIALRVSGDVATTQETTAEG